MSTFKVDDEIVKEEVQKLQKLLRKCEDAYNQSIPESQAGKGKTHEELALLCENIKMDYLFMGELIHKTIEFLGQTSDMFRTSDKSSADKIANGGTGSGTIDFGQGGSFSSGGDSFVGGGGGGRF